jgi:hypothetical protein
MGLADEKLKLGFNTEMERSVKAMAAKDYKISYAPDWTSLTPLTQEMIGKVQGATKQFSNFIQNLSINFEHAPSKMTWDAIVSSISTVTPVHTPTMKGYDYSLEIKDKVLFIRANYTEFMVSSSSKDQKDFRPYLESLL